MFEKKGGSSNLETTDMNQMPPYEGRYLEPVSLEGNLVSPHGESIKVELKKEIDKLKLDIEVIDAERERFQDKINKKDYSVLAQRDDCVTKLKKLRAKLADTETKLANSL